MAYNNANMLRIAQIGAMTRPQFRNMPTLDFGGAVDNFTKARDKSLEAARRQAYVDELTAQHPEAAAQIAANPDAYAKMINDNAAAERDQQFKMDMLDKQFNNSIALQDKQHANAVGLAKLAAQLKANGTTGMQNIEYLQGLGFSPEEAAQLYYGGNNPTLNMANLGKKGAEALDKKIGENMADEFIADKQTQKLSPITQTAIDAAKESLANGVGLGQIGGWGWTTGQGGINRENLARAQRQMNIQIRGALKAVGVGSKELDAAAEAEAYRARLDPKLPIDQQMQILNNFEQDYLSGNLHKELAEKYGKSGLHVGQQINGYKIERID